MREKSLENPNKMIIECVCGKNVILKRVGGQYQNRYEGDCECGRKWSLGEFSELLKELEDC